MRCPLMLFLMLVIQTGPAAAQAVSPDSQMEQTLLSEIRALRLDLRNTAATIQRVQIVMYRLQAQAALVDKAEQRLDQARGQCKLAQDQQKFTATQIEQVRKQNANNAADQKAAEQMISQLQAAMETWVGQAQQCQVEQVDAETQFRAEQAKMTALEDQLVQLDQVLAGHDRK
jgi:chromosome segregation ATPase